MRKKMRILHCADLHLDSKLNANLDETKVRQRRNEILNGFVRMVEYAESEKIEHILIAGDLFDKNKVSATARKVVEQTLRDHPDITFYYLSMLDHHDYYRIGIRCHHTIALHDNYKDWLKRIKKQELALEKARQKLATL